MKAIGEIRRGPWPLRWGRWESLAGKKGNSTPSKLFTGINQSTVVSGQKDQVLGGGAGGTQNRRKQWQKNRLPSKGKQWRNATEADSGTWWHWGKYGKNATVIGRTVD